MYKRQVYEGTVVREKAVLGAGVILTRGTPVYDLVNETVHLSLIHISEPTRPY